MALRSIGVTNMKYHTKKTASGFVIESEPGSVIEESYANRYGRLWAISDYLLKLWEELKSADPSKHELIKGDLDSVFNRLKKQIEKGPT